MIFAPPPPQKKSLPPTLDRPTSNKHFFKGGLIKQYLTQHLVEIGIKQNQQHGMIRADVDVSPERSRTTGTPPLNVFGICSPEEVSPEIDKVDEFIEPYHCMSLKSQ